MNYGLPYMGSKSRHAEWLFAHIPDAPCFYDLFCGGCAAAHKALLSGRFAKVHINDIHADIPNLFIDAIDGRYRNETRWISRADFFAFKDTDAYVRYCWSFGNDGKSYIYGKRVEPYQNAIHEAVVFSHYEPMKGFGFDLSELSNIEGLNHKRAHFRKILARYAEQGVVEKRESHFAFNGMLSFDNIRHLESLNRLQHLESLNSFRNNLSFTHGDYRAVPIKPGSVIYCDIPYKNTSGYHAVSFDYEAFYDWCGRQTELVMISEYAMPEEHFICIAEKETRSTRSSHSNSTKATERLFIPIHQQEQYRAMSE